LTIKKLFFFLDLLFRHSLSLQFNELPFCVRYVESHPKKKIFLILSILSSPVDTLSSLHKYRQIDSVFIFSEALSYDKVLAENLLNNYAKIIGIYTDKHELLRAINENIDLTLKQELSFSFYNQHQKSTRELSKESSLFLWSQLFKGRYSHF
jgi:hypothetical protein